MLKNCISALPSVMHDDGALNLTGLAQLITPQLAHCSGFVLLGTTGEAHTLSLDEKKQLLTHARAEISPSHAFIVGCSAIDPHLALTQCQLAADCGATQTLIATPSYVRPEQSGIIAYFEFLADHSPCPILLYNHPLRTGREMTSETIEALAQHPNIVGIKECSIDPPRWQMLRQLAQTQSFSLLSGDDSTCLTALELGAHGLASVAANLYPSLMQTLIQCTQSGKMEQARALNQQLQLLFSALALESNPIPLKWALAQRVKLSAQLRLPLLPLSSQHHATMTAALDATDRVLPHTD